MNIYIPSMGRVDNQITLNYIPKKYLERTYLVVPGKEFDAYYSKYGNIVKEVLACNRKGIAKTRQWILEHSTDNYVLMLDDDLKFYYRVDMSKPNLVYIHTSTDVSRLFRRIEKLLSKYPVVGISSRQGNFMKKVKEYECGKIMNAYAFNLVVLSNLKIKFGRLPVMEDYDVNLQLLRKGYKNTVLYEYCWNQKSSNSSGGCSSYRNNDMQTKAAHKLKRLHPDFVKVIEKKTKVAWNNMKTRTDVIVQWRKAYASSQYNV